jgi:hypothetical protein
MDQSIIEQTPRKKIVMTVLVVLFVLFVICALCSALFFIVLSKAGA